MFSIFVLEPGLDVVRPGHVRERRAVGVAVTAVRVPEIDSRRSVLLAGQEVVDVDDVVRHAGVVVHVPLRDRRGAARFEEQPVRDRRAPRRLEQPVRLEAGQRDVGLMRGR